ncbi:MAG: hypothetical protein EOO38_30605, partial [Cytophagaceae bacterium]
MASQPASLTVTADDLVEFHAARLLLLIKLCGTSNRIDGLTKLAKLDFFVRYPEFFIEVCQRLGKDTTVQPASVESPMVRYHYGPWDHRYYQVLGFLEGRGLIEVRKVDRQIQFSLTELGLSTVRPLEKASSY